MCEGSSPAYTDVQAARQVATVLPDADRHGAGHGPVLGPVGALVDDGCAARVRVVEGTGSGVGDPRDQVPMYATRFAEPSGRMPGTRCTTSSTTGSPWTGKSQPPGSRCPTAELA
ncbi:hypothetical protein [Streptomyces sp. TE5632]